MTIKNATHANYMRRTLYDLKKQYPVEISIYQFIDNDIDPITGKRTATKRVIEIRKAILLPSSIARKFMYDRAYISANKNFTYGGLFDVNDRYLLIDGDDVPDGVTLDEGYVVIHDQRYEINVAEIIEDNLGYILKLKSIKGALPYSSITLKVEHNLNLVQLVALS